jgi:hypothetical protein
MIFRHATGDVRVMMLDADQPHLLPGQRPLRREVPGVEIVGNDLRLDFKDSLQMLYGLFEESVALEIFKVANVLAKESVLALGKADGVLEFSAHGKN